MPPVPVNVGIFVFLKNFMPHPLPSPDRVMYYTGMKLSVPFIPDDAYADWLLKKRGHLASLYFSLHQGPVLDARVRFRMTETAGLVPYLNRFSPIKKYCLLNTRFIRPENYFDAEFLDRILGQVQILWDAGCVDGIVFSDLYFLNALSQTGHGLVPELEAVPGVNTMLDSPAKAVSMLDALARTRFKPPQKLILDRSLNREPDLLEKTADRIRAAYPGMGIELLANEGCLLHCPFKFTHDAQISLSNAGLAREDTHRISRMVGCHKTFADQPHLFLKSPFIRPEDVRHYERVADTLKICGRTLGPIFLKGAVKAYAARSYDGNLLSLMDAANFLADHFHLDNQALGREFLNPLANCDKYCKRCDHCRTLFNTAARKKPLILKSYKDLT